MLTPCVAGIVPGVPPAEPKQEAVLVANNTLAVPAPTKSCVDPAGMRCVILILTSVERRSKHEDAVKGSSASVRTADTKSSKSSRSSRSSSRSGRRESGERAARRRRTDSGKDEEPIEFVIYLLGDRLDVDMNSWHG